jgi:HAD superfamily hydrolase (TIGR01509 family)
MTIRAMVFDCGGVLLRDGDLSAYGAWEERLGLPQGELARRLWTGETWELAQVGRITDAEYWRRMGEELGVTTPAQVDRLREDLWDTWILDAQVLSLVERAGRQYRVAILSNATDALEDLLEHRYGVADRFEAIINSACVGIAKPDVGIYEAMLQQLHLQAGEVLFVDDRAENIAAAARLGIHVLWFVHAEELERQLAIFLDGGNDGRGDHAAPDSASRATGQDLATQG